MRTTLCCEVQPAVVAVGSIFLAACDLGICLAKDTQWYELFDVTWDDVVKVCTTILSLYKCEPPKYMRLLEETAASGAKHDSQPKRHSSSHQQPTEEQPQRGTAGAAEEDVVKTAPAQEAAAQAAAPSDPPAVASEAPVKG